MAVQEDMIRKQDRFCNSAHRVTFNDPILADRLKNIQAIGATPIF